MNCPYCQTDNREDRDVCYQCNKDISMLRLLVNKSRHHYNSALEHAERGRLEEAAAELTNALDLDAGFTQARVVLGTVYAKMEEMEKARETWRQAISQEINLKKALEYLDKVDSVIEDRPTRKWLRRAIVACGLLTVGVLFFGVKSFLTPGDWAMVGEAASSLAKKNIKEASDRLTLVATSPGSEAAAAKTAETLSEMTTEIVNSRLQRVREETQAGNYDRAFQEIAWAREHTLPDDRRSEVETLERQIIAQIGIEADELVGQLGVARSGREVDAIANRIAALDVLAKEEQLRAKLARAAAEATRTKSLLPYDTTSDHYEVRESRLLDFVYAVQDGKWAEADSNLSLLLSQYHVDSRKPVAQLAEALWAEKLIGDGANLADAPSPKAVPANYPDIPFKPLEIASARMGAPTATQAATDPSTAASDPIPAGRHPSGDFERAWFESNEAILASGSVDGATARLAKLNLAALEGAAAWYYGGLVSLAGGDEAGAGAMLDKLYGPGGDGELADKLAGHLKR
jgi:tetratricopeptide (TPR) repeat protein